MDFNRARSEITHVTGDPQALGNLQGKISIADALHTAANKIVFRVSHTVYDANASFALFHAVMPPATFETLRKPNCWSMLAAIDER